MRRNGDLGTSGKSSGDLATFSVDFVAFYKLKIRRISTYGLFYLLRQVRSRYSHPLPSYCVLATDTLRDLVTLTFDLDQFSYMAGHVITTAKKLEDPMPIRS